MSIESKMQLPIFHKSDYATLTFDTWFENVLQVGKSYTVDFSFLEALFFQIYLKKDDPDECWPLLFLWWPGGKQPIKSKAHMGELLDNIYRQINPTYCSLFLMDIRAELFAQYTDEAAEELGENTPLAVMWNPDKILDALKCEKEQSKDLWCNRSARDLENLAEPKLLHTEASKQYPAYGTSSFRQTMSKLCLCSSCHLPTATSTRGEFF